MLEARALSKRYGGFLALDRVDFQVRRGEILGYLGPNGSGKSTTVNTVVGLIDPSGGSLWTQVHRVGGYVTVFWGGVIAVSAVALSGPLLGAVIGGAGVMSVAILFVSYRKYAHA